MKKNSWRYVSLSQDALASINHYDPTDAIIDKIDEKNREDDSFHESTTHVNPDLYAVLDKSSMILTPRQKEIVGLRLIDDMTFAEIGEVTGSTRQNCRQTFNLAIEKLRMLYMPDGQPGNKQPGNKPDPSDDPNGLLTGDAGLLPDYDGVLPGSEC